MFVLACRIRQNKFINGISRINHHIIGTNILLNRIDLAIVTNVASVILIFKL